MLTTLYLTSARNTNNWRARKGDLQRAFPIDIPMVPSSVLAITSDGECLSCSGFSLSETIRFGSLEFITDLFGGLSLSPMWAVQTTSSWAQPTSGRHPHFGP
jgi:hypothetical protein